MTEPSAQEPRRFGPYLLLDRINVGGMAEVFRAKASGAAGFERIVALKRILPSVSSDPDFVDMFVDEAKIAVQLLHANVAQTYDLGQVDGQFYIALEYVSGVDLRTLWSRARKRKRLLPVPISLYIMQKVCEGLEFAHSKTDAQGAELGLVHRDISPHNILCSFEGGVKIIDFGIAKVANKVSKTQAGALKGKFGYMSPEQIRGYELDGRSDIFACGTVLYELLVGRRCFTGDSDFSILEKIRDGEFDRPQVANPALPAELEQIILRALETEPEARYARAGDMARDIGAYMYASGQAFGQSELQTYMLRYFTAEHEEERRRLERYAELSAGQAQRSRRDPSGGVRVRAASSSTEPSFTRREPSDDTRVDAVRGPASSTRSHAFDAGTGSGTHRRSDTTRTGSHTDIPAATGSGVGASPAAERRLPAWAAALIGALSVVALGAVGWLAVLLTQAPELRIETEPPTARIFVDDRLRGERSPLVLDDLEAGDHVLRVEASGRATVLRKVTLSPGRSHVEVIQLPGAPAPSPPAP